MTEEMAGREILDPEAEVSPVIDPSHEIEAGCAWRNWSS